MTACAAVGSRSAPWLVRAAGLQTVAAAKRLLFKSIFAASNMRAQTPLQSCTVPGRSLDSCRKAEDYRGLFWHDTHGNLHRLRYGGVLQPRSARLHSRSDWKLVRNSPGHTAAVKGVAIAPSGDVAVSCSTDCTVRLWKLPFAPFHAGDVEQVDQAVLQFQGSHGFRSAHNPRFKCHIPTMVPVHERSTWATRNRWPGGAAVLGQLHVTAVIPSAACRCMIVRRIACCCDSRRLGSWLLASTSGAKNADCSAPCESQCSSVRTEWRQHVEQIESCNYRGIDHHWRDNTFATAGTAVDVWDHERSEPVTSLTWGADSMHSVRFNPVCDCLSVLMHVGPHLAANNHEVTNAFKRADRPAGLLVQ